MYFNYDMKCLDSKENNLFEDDSKFLNILFSLNCLVE